MSTDDQFSANTANTIASEASLWLLGRITKDTIGQGIDYNKLEKDFFDFIKNRSSNPGAEILRHIFQSTRMHLKCALTNMSDRFQRSHLDLFINTVFEDWQKKIESVPATPSGEKGVVENHDNYFAVHGRDMTQRLSAGGTWPDPVRIQDVRQGRQGRPRNLLAARR